MGSWGALIPFLSLSLLQCWCPPHWQYLGEPPEDEADMARHQSRKDGQLGQQTLLRGHPEEGLVNENLRGPASNVLRGGGWKLLGGVAEKLGEPVLYSPESHSNCPAKKWGGGDGRG